MAETLIKHMGDHHGAHWAGPLVRNGRGPLGHPEELSAHGATVSMVVAGTLL